MRARPRDRLATLIEPVQYRDITLGVQDEAIGAHVTAIRDVEDVYNPGRTVPFGACAWVPHFLLEDGNEALFYDWLFQGVLMDMERHEAAEHFLVAGVRIFDPHKERV